MVRKLTISTNFLDITLPHTGLANIRHRAIALREQRQRLRDQQQQEGVATAGGGELGELEMEVGLDIIV